MSLELVNALSDLVELVNMVAGERMKRPGGKQACLRLSFGTAGEKCEVVSASFSGIPEFKDTIQHINRSSRTREVFAVCCYI